MAGLVCLDDEPHRYGPVEKWGPVKAVYFTIATVTT